MFMWRSFSGSDSRKKEYLATDEHGFTRIMGCSGDRVDTFRAWRRRRSIFSWQRPVGRSPLLGRSVAELLVRLPEASGPERHYKTNSGVRGWGISAGRGLRAWR